MLVMVGFVMVVWRCSSLAKSWKPSRSSSGRGGGGAKGRKLKGPSGTISYKQLATEEVD